MGTDVRNNNACPNNICLKGASPYLPAYAFYDSAFVVWIQRAMRSFMDENIFQELLRLTDVR